MIDGLHIFQGLHEGPSTVIAGLTHGNEPVGLEVISYLSTQLSSLQGNFRGTLYLLEVNTEGHKRGVRSIDTDMNRAFGADASGYEATRAKDIMAYFQDKKIDYVFDFHSTPGNDIPMMISTNNQKSISLASIFPISHLIVGLPGLVSGTTLLEYFCSIGATDLAFETGQHNDPDTITRGITVGNIIFQSLHATDADILASTTAKDKQTIIHATKTFTTSSKEFRFTKEYQSFDPIGKGEVRGIDTQKEYSFDEDMIILIPNHGIQKDLETISSTWIAHFGKEII